METAVDAGAPAETAHPRPAFSKRRAIVLGIAGVLVLLALGWMLSWQSPVPVREVRVSGALAETEPEILAAAGVPVGVPLRDLDAEAITARVVALPGIDRADLVLARPWTVVVDVVQRFPFVSVRSPNGWSVLDTDGQVIRDVAKQPPRLPQITVAPEQTAGVIAMLMALGEDLRGRVASVSANPDSTLVLELRTGARVVWGRSERNEEKASVLGPLLGFEAETYNVSVPERPALAGALKLPKENRPKPEPTQVAQ